jgi:DNA-binding winged helix-turn-helix (wHTH) protein
VIVVNAITGEWTIDGAEQTPLRRTCAMILALLVERKGRIVTFDAFREHVWDRDFVEPGNVRVQIAAIRKILRSVNAPVEIQTFKGRGWRLMDLPQ